MAAGNWFDEQGYTPERNAIFAPDGWGGRAVLTDEERARQRQELIDATGGQWNPDPNAPPPQKVRLDDPGISHLPTMDFRTGGDAGASEDGISHLPTMGFRTGEAGASAPDPRQGHFGPYGPNAGGALMPQPSVPNYGAPMAPPPQNTGTLGGVGMGGAMAGSGGSQVGGALYGGGIGGGGNAFGGAVTGMFGGGGGSGQYANIFDRMRQHQAGGGQAQTSALQSQSGYGGGSLGGMAGGGGAMMRAPNGVSRQVPRMHVPFYAQRGATEIR